MPPDRETDYVAVVLHYYDPQALSDCVESIRAQTVQPAAIIVMDNGSNDGDLAALAADDLVEVVVEPANAGYGKAMDDGRERSSEAFATLFLTQDCALDPGAAAQLLTALSADPRNGVVGPVLWRQSDRARIWSAGGTLRGLSLWPGHATSPPATAADVAWLDGAALLVRNEVFAQAQLDGGYFLYFEDIEFCLRARIDGWRVAVVPEAVAWQEPGDLNVYLATRNHLRFVRRNGSPVNVLAALIRHLVYVVADVARAASAYRRYRLRQRIYGLLDAFTGELRSASRTVAAESVHE